MFTLKKALLSNCGAMIEMSRSRAVEMKRKATLVLRLVRIFFPAAVIDGLVFPALQREVKADN